MDKSSSHTLRVEQDDSRGCGICCEGRQEVREWQQGDLLGSAGITLRMMTAQASLSSSSTTTSSLRLRRAGSRPRAVITCR
eukprot:1508937-Rhodomonas_salina.1